METKKLTTEPMMVNTRTPNRTKWYPGTYLALQHDSSGGQPLHEDRQRAEYEGSRRRRRHRLFEEHRIRQLLQRRALALRLPDQHVLFHRHAGRGRAAPLADGPAGYGWPPRRVAWRTVFGEPQVPFLSEAHAVRHRPGGHRPAAARHHR